MPKKTLKKTLQLAAAELCNLFCPGKSSLFLLEHTK
jgi:hypothetical protein